MTLLALYLDTLRGLAAPRRAVPILLVCAAMAYAQTRMGGSLAEQLPAVVMAAVFVLLAPFAWRALFPPRPVRGRVLRIGLFALAGALPSALGWVTAQAFGLGWTFVTFPFHLPVTGALFCAGGWGLGRDIELEQGLARERERAARLAEEAERAQLLAIRAHLDPHFLFNTLNAIAEWCREDGETAEAAILRLSGLLREVLGGIRAPAWPLATELGLVRDLLELHRMRDPTWFTVEWSVPADLPLEVPPLLLLPLAENAVTHGPAKGHRGVIALRAERDGAGARIALTSPGPYGGPRPDGTGLRTVRRRLELAYARGGALTVDGDARGTRVEVYLPAAAPERPT